VYLLGWVDMERLCDKVLVWQGLEVGDVDFT